MTGTARAQPTLHLASADLSPGLPGSLTARYLSVVRLSLLASTLLPAIATVCSRILLGAEAHVVSALEVALNLVAVLGLNLGCFRLLRALAQPADESARAQARHVDALPERYVDWAIVGSAALSLALELAVIRWQASVFELFALYKNLGLLACFAGLGLGYALAGRDRIPLAWTLPLLAWQMLLLVFLRHGLPGPAVETNGQSWRIQSLLITPFPEQRNIGFAVAGDLVQFVAPYCFLATLFVLSALPFVPVGQLCGRTMTRRRQLRAYGLNLIGSLLGVVLMLGLGALWSPPLAWFAPLFGLLMSFQGGDRSGLRLSGAAALAAGLVLAWPVSFDWERIHSPYQLIERGPGERGLTVLRAAGHYYQKVHDLSAESQSTSEERRRVAYYYELPYRIHGRPQNVAILGAGTGNDVAAALRGGASRVVAVEIDPVILRLGTLHHPERPYSDPRVQPLVDDARSFLRTTAEHFDLVVYGLLDSHTLLSHASSVRLESFVYTVEGLKEARRRLKDDGVLSLSFAVVSKQIGRKIYLMLSEAFDGRPPVCVRGAYDGSVVYLQRNHGELVLPDDLGLDRRRGFWVMERFADPSTRADVSTDDWPFLYMAVRQYPKSYLAMGGLVLLLTLLLAVGFLGEAPSVGGGVFFFLGAGFMLVETKAITELGLTFGNTWQVVGVSIAGILVMAFLATLLVPRARFLGSRIPFLLLLASLAAGWMLARSGGFPPTAAGRVATVALLSCPILFSGLLFARFLEKESQVPAAMAANLLGAMLGGLLEYNAMYFGFHFLYGLAAALYLMAFVASLRR